MNTETRLGKRFVIAAILLAITSLLSSQAATVTLTMQDSSFPTQVNNGGDFFNNGATELGMWANTGSKQTAGWGNLGTSGFGGTSRSLQVGDVFTITVAATRAFGQIGFSLNNGGTQGGSYDNRTSGSRLYINTDNYGSWYVGGLSGGGTSTFNYSPSQDTFRDYQFKIFITSETTGYAELWVNGTYQSAANNLTLGGTAGENISALSIYGADMWDGNNAENAYWKQTSTISDAGSVNIGYNLGGSSTFNVGVIANGLAANSASSVTTNSVNIGGDAGSVVILDDASTYGGNTTVNANATALAANNAAFGTDGTVTVTSGGAVQLSNNISSARAITLNGTGVSSSGGALRNVSGNNTNSGAITLGSASRINSDSGTLTLDVSSGNAISGTQNLTIGGSGNVTVGDNINIGSAKLVKDGAGVLTLGAAMNYTGNTEIDAGTLSINSSGDLNDGSMVYLGSGTAGQNATLQLAGTTAFGNALQINEGAGSRTISKTDATSQTMSGNITNNDSSTISVSQSGGNLTLSGVLAGTNALSKTGAGTLTLSGSSANTMNAATTISAGTLILNKSANIAAVAGQVTVDSGATLRTDAVNQLNNQLIVNNGSLDFSGNGQSLALGGAGTVTLGAATMTNNNSGPDTFSGRITGAGGLVKAGVGNFTLSGTSDYSGATTVNAGTLTISGGQGSSGYTLSGGNLTTSGSANLSDTATVTISSGSSTFTVGANDTIGSFGGAAGTVSIATNVVLTTGDSGNSSFSGVISGQGALIKAGAGTFTLDGSTANTYSGTTTVNAGVLVLSKSGDVNALAGTPTINSGGVIRLAAGNQFNGNSTFLTVNSGGLFDMNGFNETLAIQGAGTISLGSGIMTINPTETDTFSGVIAGSGAVIKTNAGTQVLSGANTYAGATTVGAGILEIQNGTGLGTTAAGTTVASGAQLKLYNASSMTVDEAVTLNGSGITATGALRNVGGDNTVSGNITLGSNSRIQSDIAGSLAISGAVAGGNNVLSIGGTRNTSISGAIDGAGSTNTSLIKDGAGTLTLSGNNTYTGDTRVNAGRLAVAAGGNLGNGSDVFISDGATLAVDANSTVASIQETGTGNGGEVAIGSGATLTINGSNKGTMLQDTISGAGNLVVNGSGTTSLSLYGTQSWSGTTTVSGGKLSTGVALGTSGLTINGGTFETSAVNILGNIVVSLSSGTYSLGGADTVGSFAISGGEISGANTLTAATYALNGGTVTANLGGGTATAASGTTAIDGTLGATTVNVSGGTVNLGANDRLANGATVTVTSGALGMGTRTDTVGTLNVSGGSVTGTTGNKLTAATYNLTGGTIGANLGAGTLNANSGAATLNGTADATTVNVGGGALNLGSAGRLASGSAVTVSNSGSLTLGGNETVSSLAGTNGTLALGANSLTVSSGNFGSLITGSGALYKIGSGTLTLSGANTYSGGTFLNGGYLDSDSTSAFGTGAVTVATNTTLDLQSHNVANLIINNGGTILSSGTLSDVVATNGTTSIGGSDSVVVEASGSATVNVSGSGVTVSNVSGTAAVNIGGTDATVDTVAGGTVTLSNTATGSRVNTANAGTVNANAAGVNVGTVSNTGTVNVGGTNGRVGTLAGGTLNANAGGLVVTNYNGGNIAVSTNVTVGLRGGNSSGVISGSGGIAKQGASTLTLSGANTYSGATTVEEGKLVVNGSIQHSTVTVASGAVLGGNGTVGDTTILSGAKIGPGSSPGTLNIAGDLTWSGGGSYDWEIYNTVGAAGSEWDWIDVDGSLLFSGLSSSNTFTINIFSLSALPNTVGALAGWNSATNWSWTILSAGTGMGAFDANNFTLNTANFSANSLDGGTFSLAADGGDLNLLFTAGGGPGPSPVPEPGTWAAAALLAGAAGYVRWRRRKEQPTDA